MGGAMDFDECGICSQSRFPEPVARSDSNDVLSVDFFILVGVMEGKQRLQDISLVLRSCISSPNSSLS